MARMTRTQISLEESEYRFLKTAAVESGCSLSAVVRRLVREKMEQAAPAAPHVWEVAGLLTNSSFTGKDHDRVLYGRVDAFDDAWSPDANQD